MDMISSCAPFDGPSVPLIWLLKILTIVWPVSCTRSSGALSSQWVLDLLRLFWSFFGVKWSQPMHIHWGLNFPRRCHMMQQSSNWQWNLPLHLQPLGKCLTEQQLQWDLNASRTYHEDPLIKSNHIIIMLQRYAVVLRWIEQFWCLSLRWAVFFWLSGPLYSCAAYAAVYAMPTRPQWEPTRLIPLKVCLRRPNARVKRRLNVRFCLRRHTSVCFWKVGNGTFAYATTVPFTFLVSGVPYGTLHSLQQHERPGSKAPIDILQPYPCAAAAPATRSQSAH